MTVEEVCKTARESRTPGLNESFIFWLRAELLQPGMSLKGILVRVPGESPRLAGITRVSHPEFPFADPNEYDVIGAYFFIWYAAQSHLLPNPVNILSAAITLRDGNKAAIKAIQRALDQEENGDVTTDLLQAVQTTSPYSTARLMAERYGDQRGAETLKVMLLAWFGTELKKLQILATDVVDNCTLLGAGSNNGSEKVETPI